MSDTDKLDPADVQFLLQLIAHAKGCGIAEIEYRSCRIRFSSLMTRGEQTAKISASNKWQTKLTNE